MKQSIVTILTATIFLVFIEKTEGRIIPVDSLGIRNIGGQSYIIHQVEKGETLYRLSRRYAVQVNDIIGANPNSNRSIQVGEELRIPFKGSGITTSPPTSGSRITHEVKPGETLFAIARIYNVSVDDIKKWNSMRSNNLSIGDKLTINVNADQAAEINELKNIRENNSKKVHVVNKGETVYSIANKYDITTYDIKTWNRLEDNAIFVGQELVIGFTDNQQEEVVITNELKVQESEKQEVPEVKKKEIEGTGMVNVDDRSEYKKVSEKGIARVIEGSEETKKYLALHRTAPIGTIMQVKNEMNDLSVFVRVIGKLPETGDNSNILLKISKTAYDRLGAYDSQFPVEITYHP